MSYILIILFAFTLVYFVLAERVSKFINLLIAQGVLLFGFAFYNLINVHPAELVLILLETIIVKAVAIPYTLNKVRKHNNLKRFHEPLVPVYFCIVIVVSFFIIGFMTAKWIHFEGVESRYFAISIATVLTGLFFIINHKNIFSHITGFLILENGVFLLSLAVGSQMPMLVGIAVLLDIFIGVLIFALFINRLGDTFKSISVSELSQIKD
jgi:hydrogenase-4 component E